MTQYYLALLACSSLGLRLLVSSNMETMTKPAILRYTIPIIDYSVTFLDSPIATDAATQSKLLTRKYSDVDGHSPNHRRPHTNYRRQIPCLCSTETIRATHLVQVARNEEINIKLHTSGMQWAAVAGSQWKDSSVHRDRPYCITARLWHSVGISCQ